MNQEALYIGNKAYTKEDWLIHQERIGVNSKSSYHIAMCVNDAYVKWAGILMESIMIKNPNLKKTLCFHLLTDSIYEEDKEKLKRLAKKWNIPIVLYFMNDNNVDQFSRFTRSLKNGKFLYSMYYRWLIPYVVDQGIEQILYIDTDIVCVNDIFPLLQEKFEEPFLVVHDMAEEYHATRLGMKSGFYFNSGFVYMNISKVKEQKVMAKILQYLHDCVQNHVDLMLPDQDAANIVLDGNVRYASDLYNFPYPLISKEMTKREIHKEAAQAYFVHFLTPIKQWNAESQGFPAVEIWANAKKRSEWKDVKLLENWNRKAYRVAYRAALLNKNYLKWMKYKLGFALYSLKRDRTR